MRAARAILPFAVLLIPLTAATAQPPFGQEWSMAVKGGGFSPDGKWILLLSERGAPALWDAVRGERVHPCTVPMPIDWVPGVTVVMPGPSAALLGVVDERDAKTGAEYQTLEVFKEECGIVLGPQVAKRNWLDRASEPVNDICCLAVSSNGWRAVAGCRDGKVRLWDVPSGKYLRTIRGCVGPVTALAFSPHGTRALCVSRGGQEGSALTLLDLSTGKALFAFGPAKAGEPATGTWDDLIAFSPSGRHAVAARRLPDQDYSLVLWDTVTGEEVRCLPGRARRIAFTADGQHLLGIYGGPVSTLLAKWSLTTGQVVGQISVNVKPNELSFAAFSPDGSRLVTASGSITGGGGGSDTLLVHLWDTTSGKLIGTLYQPRPPVEPRYPVDDPPPPPRPWWRFWERF
jgi:WD40 repeat protein